VHKNPVLRMLSWVLPVGRPENFNTSRVWAMSKRCEIKKNFFSAFEPWRRGFFPDRLLTFSGSSKAACSRGKGIYLVYIRDSAEFQ